MEHIIHSLLSEIPNVPSCLLLCQSVLLSMLCRTIWHEHRVPEFSRPDLRVRSIRMLETDRDKIHSTHKRNQDTAESVSS